MTIRFSQKLLEDMQETVRIALARDGIVNIPLIAEEVRRRNESDNVALEDITAQLMLQAQSFSAAMEFDTPTLN